MTTFVDTTKPDAPQQIAHALVQNIKKVKKEYRGLLFLCIGSDRVTGDCLGPLTGQLLYSRLPEKMFVYGTLSSTVHACNLSEITEQIQAKHSHALVIAIDASLGNKKHLGYAAISNGALLPGAGVQKHLPAVGDVHITGVVNTSGAQNYLMLQATKLSTVLALSDTIAQGILLALPFIPLRPFHFS